MCSPSLCVSPKVCDDNNDCVCGAFQYGADCNIFCSPDSCAYGNCDSEGTCVCDPDYYGPQCDKLCSPDICQSPKFCDVNGDCVCGAFYYGENCDIFCSPDTCTYGTCDSEGTCVCELGWSGSNCDIRLFLHPNGNYVADCGNGFYGNKLNYLCYPCIYTWFGIGKVKDQWCEDNCVKRGAKSGSQ